LTGANTTIEQITSLDRIIIYGAGIMGKALKLCLEAKPFAKKVHVFIVKDIRSNPGYIEGTNVIEIGDAVKYKKDTIIIALNENNMPEAVKDLKVSGFDNLLMLNAAGDEWMSIKRCYFLYNQDKCYIPFKVLPDAKNGSSNNANVSVYVVKSIYDKKINHDFPLREYEQEIQVGSALTDRRICALTDDCGENISHKNRQYCELTALYWVWKNCNNDYIGISHYRRRFDIESETMRYIQEANADIVVTVPVINTEGIGPQYGRTHSIEDWDLLRDEVHNVSPEYDESFEFVERQIYFHAYNMFVMRKDILRCFCEWMFPILFACEKKIGIKENTYQNRYPGFLSERLLNVFLYKHKDKYNIFIANKRYLS
jgi:hypothetical protein